jgi:hypothetical protein
MENLSTFLIPAPLSTLLTIISGISFAFVFDFYGRKIFRSDEPVLRALYFFGGLLCLGWTIWMICLAKIASVLFFRILLGAFIAHGGILVPLWRFRRQYLPEILSISGVFILTFLRAR